jgi:hypothetical protein
LRSLPIPSGLNERGKDRAGKLALRVAALGVPLHGNDKVIRVIKLYRLNDAIGRRNSSQL